MAHGILQSFNPKLTVCSAGTAIADRVNPDAITAMDEIGIDISHHTPKHIEQYLGEEWDYVITVCDNAKEVCPLFTGHVRKRLHMGFEDPSEATGAPEVIKDEFRRVRDEIRKAFLILYTEELSSQL